MAYLPGVLGALLVVAGLSVLFGWAVGMVAAGAFLLLLDYRTGPVQAAAATEGDG